MNECDHFVVELKVERIRVRCRSVGRHSRDDACIIQFLFCNRTALVKCDLAALDAVPLMVGIEVMGAHHDLGHYGWVMVGVAPREVTRSAVTHNHPSEVKNHCVNCSGGHMGLKYCWVPGLTANWLWQRAQVGLDTA